MARIGTSELDVFPLNLGGNVFGWTADREQSFAILDAFVAAGGDFVDTADSYSRWLPGHRGGESETIIGEWLAARKNRDRIVIATKVGRHADAEGLRPDNIKRGADASLTRLGVDHIDLYYAHYDDPEVPVADFVGALSELVDAGKVRYIAPSNFTAERIDEWLAVTVANGLNPPVALQPLYSLVERGFETNGLKEAAENHKLGVLPYYSLASGFLSGKYRPGEKVDSARAGNAAKYLNPRGERVLKALDTVASARGAEVATVALAWLRAQATVVAPIASVSRPEQLPALVASVSLELSPDDIASLNAASAPDPA